MGGRRPTTILVVGAGAIGGYFGGRLAQVSRDITFLVCSRRAEEIRASGLHIISPHGDVTIKPKLINASEVRSGYDIVATQLDGDGRIIQLADFQSLTYGELDRKQTPRLETVDQALRVAGFDASVSSHILQDMWQKWVQLVSLIFGNQGSPEQSFLKNSPHPRTLLDHQICEQL